ncbi:MAG: hypothetical protein KQH63_05765, partial [Desulfobulbaceae bacterium]|nr:hypothetical protein [Desulfobulbaceae bacterium]
LLKELKGKEIYRKDVALSGFFYRQTILMFKGFCGHNVMDAPPVFKCFKLFNFIEAEHLFWCSVCASPFVNLFV